MPSNGLATRAIRRANVEIPGTLPESGKHVLQKPAEVVYCTLCRIEPVRLVPGSGQLDRTLSNPTPPIRVVFPRSCLSKIMSPVRPET